MKKLNFLLPLFLLLIAVGCQKMMFEKVDAVEKSLAGEYQVNYYRETVYDSLGKQLSQTNHLDYGTIELIMNTNEGPDVFSHFIFRGPVSYTYVPGLLNKGNYCGERDPAQQLFGVLYQCDPYKKRILLAAICPLETVSVYTDYTYDGKVFHLFLRVTDAGTQEQHFYEYNFIKK